MLLMEDEVVPTSMEVAAQFTDHLIEHMTDDEDVFCEMDSFTSLPTSRSMKHMRRLI